MHQFNTLFTLKNISLVNYSKMLSSTFKSMKQL